MSSAHLNKFNMCIISTPSKKQINWNIIEGEARLEEEEKIVRVTRIDLLIKGGKRTQLDLIAHEAHSFIPRSIGKYFTHMSWTRQM